MYKHVFLFFMLIGCAGLLAQPASKVQFGIRLSPSISWVDVVHDDVQAEGATLKIGGGGFADFRLTSFMSFVTGLNYNGFGGYVLDSVSLGSSTYRESYKLNYTEIEVPLALKINTPYVNKTSYFVQGGISLGFVTSANEKHYAVAEDVDPKYDNIDLYTSPSRVSYQLGAGVEYNLYRNSTVFGMITFNKSLSNSANNTNYLAGQNPRYSTPLEIRPGRMEFSIGVKF